MIGRALNRDNDIFLDANGSLALVEEGAETVQHVRTRLQFFLEEWFLDLTAGTPWFQTILVKPINLGTVESIIKARILETPGVEELTAFSMAFDSDTRFLDVEFSAVTVYGTIDNTRVTING